MRLILDADKDYIFLAFKAATSLHNSDHKECIYTYGRDGEDEVAVFYAKRNRASISSRQIEPKMKDGKETQDQTS